MCLCLSVKLMSTLGMGILIYFSGDSVNSIKCVTANKLNVKNSHV